MSLRVIENANESCEILEQDKAIRSLRRGTGLLQVETSLAHPGDVKVRNDNHGQRKGTAGERAQSRHPVLIGQGHTSMDTEDVADQALQRHLVVVDPRNEEVGHIHIHAAEE